jgi:hypothetical protein
MSFIPKPGTVVSVALVLASIGTTSLNAQTPVENSSTIAVATAVTTTVESTRVTASTATAKSTSPPEPQVPQTVDQDKWQFQFSPYFWLAGLLALAALATAPRMFQRCLSRVELRIHGNL